MRMPHPLRARRARRAESRSVLIAAMSAAGIAIIDDLRTRPPLEIKHVVRHMPRPPAPRPMQLTVEFEMQRGQRYSMHVPLNGQPFWQESWPNWLLPEYGNQNWPPTSIRFHLRYADGSPIR